MLFHLAQYDITGTVDLSSAEAVADTVCSTLGQRDGGIDDALIHRSFGDLAAAFWGNYPGLQPCDTPYHDLRHSLGTTLVTARLVDGYEAVHQGSGQALGRELRTLAVLLALFHDIGFLRRDDELAVNGASLIKEHEARSVEFSRAYLRQTPLAHLADQAELIQTTNFARPVAATLAGRSEPLCVVGRLIGTADLVSQMAGRYYLERCRDYLYREFVIAGADRVSLPDGSTKMLYTSGEDLLSKTPGFYDHLVKPRLENEFAQSYRYLTAHFGGSDPYTESIQHNLAFLQEVIASGDFSRLKRRPPALLPDSVG